MTPTLRKYHRNIWPIFGLTLIVSLFMAYKSLPNKEENSTSSADLTFSVSVPNDYVEIELSGTLSTSSLLFYASNNEEDSVDNDWLLGQINSLGKRKFQLDSTILALPIIYFKGYNPIKKEVVLKAVVN